MWFNARRSFGIIQHKRRLGLGFSGDSRDGFNFKLEYRFDRGLYFRLDRRGFARRFRYERDFFRDTLLRVRYVLRNGVTVAVPITDELEHKIPLDTEADEFDEQDGEQA